ncbi:sigma-54-dependent transcriptional regulator [Desulfobotulus mexicanus]|uniref:Sigma-54-dependent Fis family transcriptional regulator n=1 Tax=Desulfobotulus mexicanus TaxID=2586642 RepID=A0A5Q4VCZ0_9BACT|nr:sigma-54 dependent transcriptional regulator [Desulfobotulus mexicanus]TYT75455.1 sigma-54-dependent Fis family transcriptional regulator [Desulfobotulus mexicanus]
MSMEKIHILVVEDEAHSRNTYRILLRQAGFENIHLLDRGDAVLPFLEKNSVACILLDLNLPGTNGETLLPRIHEEYPHIPVLILTGVHFVETAVRCMQKGAFDFMTKPVERERLLVGVRKALEVRDLADTTRRFQGGRSEKLKYPELFAPIITRSSAMENLFHYMEAVAPSSLPVLITGETGTGKELIAQVLHRLSGRTGEFVGCNIAGLDEALISDTLFGHERGAFTHAEKKREGLVARAKNGTLFLDEIGEMPSQTQVKLLRFLQEGDYLPVGADKPRRSSARILAATNRHPETMKEGKGFRKDLFYRLAPHSIHLPPLRERPEDIPLLLEHFSRQAAMDMNLPFPKIEKNLVQVLQKHDFPGNIREFQGLVHDAVGKSRGRPLCPDHFNLPETLTVKSKKDDDFNHDHAFLPLDPFPTLADAEASLILEALHREKGNQTRAAELLGISRQTLNRKLRQDKKSPHG